MELSMTDQAVVFLFSCAVGVFLGAVYDIFRIIRVAFNSRWLSIFFQDFIFCIFSALSVILLVYYTNSGVVRWFSLAGCFLCFLIYHLTVGRIIMFMARKIIEFVRRVLNFIKSITIVPAVKIILFMIKLLKKLAGYMLGRLRSANKHSYYLRRRSSLEHRASHGFNLYKNKKVPPAIKKAVSSEMSRQEQAERSSKKQDYSRAPHKSKKSQTLGDLRSLSSIKFK